MQELNKKTGGGGGGSGGGEDKHCGELLDNRCFMKLVEVAHGLLKMAPYDLDCIKLPGLQESSVCYHWSGIIQMYRVSHPIMQRSFLDYFQGVALPCLGSS